MNSMFLRSALRTRGLMTQSNKMMAVRGGGFHKPDPLEYADYKQTRRVHLEDVNTIFYNDNAPEFHMHLHSIQIQSGKQGWFLIGAYFTLILLPCWLVARKCHKDSGAMMFPSVRPGPDHAHMAPRILSHLK